MKDNFHKKKFRNEYHMLMGNVSYTSAFLVAALTKCLAKYDLTHPQFLILRALQNAAPECLSVTEVKEQMHDRNSDITRLVDRMIEKHLVLREQDAENRRKIKLTLSDSAVELLTSIDNEIMEFEKKLYHLTEEEAITLNKLLTKLRERLIPNDEE